MSSERGSGGTAVDHSKELVSISHMYALCARTGLNFNEPVIDNDGVDITIRGKLYEDATWTTPKLDIQLKCVRFRRKDFDFKSKVIKYQLKKHNYNALTGTNYPSILVINTVPRSQDRWITSSIYNTKIHFGCYWYSLMGEDKLTSGSSVIKIPMAQRLTPEALLWLMNKAANMELISNNGGVYV